MLPVPHPEVIFGPVADGAVLFAASSEIYYGLNEVGVKIWELLPPARTTFDELCDEIARLYPDVPAETVRQDVGELLDDLLANGLVVQRGAGEANAPDVASHRA